ncbi:hypothetical protein [Amycolatopsis minnesotensis]|uniref:Excreted virulence factor EspC (Type VII ESX diderm) n=1 Tax=Amycolatopsis minnesotensis TaxID=337894 RepID=A0ABN2SKC3_9PSEU
MGFITAPEALRTAAKDGHAAVGALRGADCGKPVAKIATALPGAKCTSNATTFSDSWSQTYTQFCDGAEQHASAFATAADAYVAGDHAAAGAIPGGDAPGGPA